jgi:hypothetical protein
MEPFELLTRDVLILLSYLFNCTATKLTLVILVNESKGEEAASCKLTKNTFGKKVVYQIFVHFSFVETSNVFLFRGYQNY